MSIKTTLKKTHDYIVDKTGKAIRVVNKIKKEDRKMGRKLKEIDYQIARSIK